MQLKPSKSNSVLPTLALMLAGSAGGGAWAVRGAHASERKIYFSGTSINNYAFDNTASRYMDRDVALICSVQILNLSTTTQVISDMGMYNHTTFYDNTVSFSGSYSPGVDLRGNGHLAKTSRDSTEFNVTYVKINLDSSAGNWSPYFNDSGATYTATRFAAGGTLSGVGTISVPPNSMVYFMGRSHALTGAFTNTADNLSVKERKLYNFCTGYLSVKDVPTAGEPKNGFLMATGFSEYIADTPVVKTMWYGETAADPSLLTGNFLASPWTKASTDSYVKAESNGRYWLKISQGNNLDGKTQDIGNSHCRADILGGVEIWSQVKCAASHKTNNKSVSSMPQHIASIPIVINGGKPF